MRDAIAGEVGSEIGWAYTQDRAYLGREDPPL